MVEECRTQVNAALALYRTRYKVLLKSDQHASGVVVVAPPQVVVEPAVASSLQFLRLHAVARLKRSQVEFGAEGVLGMRIAGRSMLARIVVHERESASLIH